MFSREYYIVFVNQFISVSVLRAIPVNNWINFFNRLTGSDIIH